MVFLPDTCGILTHYSWYIKPVAYGIVTPYPWYIGPPSYILTLYLTTHGILNLLPMVCQTTSLWDIEPQPVVY